MLMDANIEFDDSETTPDKLIQAMRRLPRLLDQKLKHAARDIVERIAGDARINAPEDTGALADSINTVVENAGQMLYRLKVGTNQDHAQPQEFGTSPFFPPPSELRDWARRVLGDESAAFPVARSIAQTGLEAQPYLVPAFRSNLAWAVDRINSAVDSALGEVGLK